MVYSDEVEKANIFDDYFRDQTLLDEDNVTVPAIDNYIMNEPLSSLVFTTDEDKAILRTLPVGKAVGPDEISNRILRELANELSTNSLYCSMRGWGWGGCRYSDRSQGPTLPHTASPHPAPTPQSGPQMWCLTQRALRLSLLF